MNYDFTAILAGCEEIAFEMGEALYEAGCDDGTQWSSNGVAGHLANSSAAARTKSDRP